jgi:hypothetical protein
MTFNQRNLTASIGREKIAKSNHLQANTIFERKKIKEMAMRCR